MSSNSHYGTCRNSVGAEASLGDYEPVAATIPLIGRHGELDQAMAHLSSKLSAAVVVMGPAGSGKSRFAAELGTELTARRFTVLRVLATPAIQHVPFGAFGVVLPELNAAADPRAAMREASESIGRMRGETERLLLIIEDAHALDDCSAALLLNLAEAGTCSLVVTSRTDQPTPDPIISLWKDEHAQRIDLTPLSGPAIAQFAEALLGGPAASATNRWLAEASEGNPMYARELLLGALHEGSLREIEGLRVLMRVPSTAPRLADLIAVRLAGLGDAAAHAVDLLAVGEPLEFDLLINLAGEEAVDQAESQGVIVRRASSGRALAGLGHPLFAEVRRSRMTYTTLRRVSRLLAEHFPRTESQGGDELVRLARWQIDAGGELDAEVLAGAAAYARSMYDLDLATEFAQRALEVGAGIAAAVTLAEANFISGRYDEAEAVLGAAAHSCTSESEIAAVATARAYNFGVLVGDRDRAEATLAEALSRLADPDVQLRVIGALATLRVYAGQPLGRVS
jgi:hypothetical protein